MKRIAALLLLLILPACEAANPHAGASVGAGGPSAGAGVSAGRVHAGVGTGGAHGSVDVIDTRNVDVGVGTGGPSASVKNGRQPGQGSRRAPWFKAWNMIRFLLFACLLLSACGVDGAPTRPGDDEPVQTNSGVTVSGDARMGVAGEL